MSTAKCRRISVIHHTSSAPSISPLGLSARLPAIGDRPTKKQWAAKTGNTGVFEQGETYERAATAVPSRRHRRDEPRLHSGDTIGLACGPVDGSGRNDD